MRSIPRDPYPLAAIIGAVVLCAATIGVAAGALDSVTYDFPLQLGLLLSLIVLLSLALLFARRVQTRLFELVAMAIVAIVVVVGVGPDVVIPLLVGSAVLVQMCLYLPARLAPAAASCFAVLICFLDRPEVAWGAPQVAPELHNQLAMLGVFLVEIAGLTSVARNRLFRARSIEDTERLTIALDRLTTANLDYQEYAASVRQLSIHEERNRVSREVHDTVGHTLTNIGIMAEASYRLVESDTGRVKQLLDRIRVQAADGLSETRAALRALRNTPDEPVTGTGRLHKLIEAFKTATGVRVALELGNLTDSLPMEVFDVLYRITQEGMTNSFRHGEASEVLVIFHITDERELHAVVRDNGKGSDGVAEGIGFRGMQERLDRFGGELTAGNWAYGFEVKASFALPSAGEESLG